MADDARPQRLTGKQQAFVDAYLGEARFNATKAAVIAGYAEKSAAEIGSENLRKSNIREVIDTELANRAMPKDAVLAEFVRHATDPAAERTEQLRALESLAKAYGMFTEKRETTLSVDGPIPLIIDGVI